MRLLDAAAKKLEEMFTEENSQKEIRDAIERKEFVCRNHILREANHFLDTEFVTLKNHERQGRADAVLQTKERLESQRHLLRQQETAGRQSIEAAYAEALPLYKNASALFAQRNTEEKQVRSSLQNRLVEEIQKIEMQKRRYLQEIEKKERGDIQEIEEEQRQIHEDDAALGCSRFTHPV